MMAHVKIGISVFQAGKTLIAELAVVERSQTRAGRIIQSVTVGVRHIEFKSVVQSFLQVRLQRIIVGKRIRTKGCDGSIDSGKGTARRQGHIRISAWDSLIAIVEAIEMLSVRARVGE